MRRGLYDERKHKRENIPAYVKWYRWEQVWFVGKIVKKTSVAGVLLENAENKNGKETWKHPKNLSKVVFL